LCRARATDLDQVHGARVTLEASARRHARANARSEGRGRLRAGIARGADLGEPLRHARSRGELGTWLLHGLLHALTERDPSVPPLDGLVDRLRVRARDDTEQGQGEHAQEQIPPHTASLRSYDRVAIALCLRVQGGLSTGSLRNWRRIAPV